MSVYTGALDMRTWLLLALGSCSRVSIQAPCSQGIGERIVRSALEAVPHGICRRGEPPSGMGFRERAVHAPEFLHRIDNFRSLRNDDALMLEEYKVESDIPSDNLFRAIE